METLNRKRVIEEISNHAAKQGRYQWTVIKGHWNSRENQILFLKQFSEKYKIASPSDWGRITHVDIINEGGSGLLAKHKSSLKRALQSLFPRIHWRNDWFITGQSYWNKQENQRMFVESFAKKNGIVSPNQWGKVTIKQFKADGGRGIICKYNSMFKMLTSLFPDVQWEQTWFQNSQSLFTNDTMLEDLTNKLKRPSGWWSSRDNQKIYLESVAKKFNIKEPKDWAKVDSKIIRDNGGRGLLDVHKRLIKALENIYPDIKWDSNWWKVKPPGYWSFENQRRFLEDLAKKYNINNFSDWGKLERDDIIKEGGLTLLSRYCSLLRILKFHFPVEWKPEWFQSFPPNYWKDAGNKMKFLEKMKIKFNIVKPEDWGKVTIWNFAKFGGRALLKRNQNSLFKTLQSIYTGVFFYSFERVEIEWKKEWFPRLPKYSKNYWDSLENRKLFINNIANEYHIKDINDWRRVTSNLIKMKGGTGFLSRYGNSLVNALHSLLPDQNFLGYNGIVSGPQQNLWKILRNLLPKNIAMFSNYKHPDLMFENSPKNMELDIWIPTFNLAFEFQGNHHYREFFNNTNNQRKRDESKKNACLKVGITLIDIPYWWDGKEVSLIATIIQHRSDLKKYFEVVKLK